MASNPPPFQVEDNTDQDFFDKLVNGDDDVDIKVATTLSASVAPVLSDGNEPDEAKAFANLGVNELDNNGDVNNDNSVDLIREIQKVDDKLEAAKESENPTIALNSIEFENLMHHPENEDVSAEALSDSKSSGERSSNATVISKSSGEFGSPGVKEVGWGVFNADSVENDGIGFGSYSDFFSELGENGLNNGSHVLIGNHVHGSANVENSNNFGQYNQGYDYGIAADQSTDVQDLNSSQYWENQYPGWKYDPSTGQWYQVDGYEQDVSYLQQTAQSSAGRSEGVTNWNQASQVDNGYPPHMVFDPQYPGWYYDTISQEWRTLESYTVSTAQGQDQMNQSGYASSDTYQSNDQKTYNVFDHGNNYYNPQGSSMWKPENVSSSVSTHGDRQNTVNYGATGSYYENASQVENEFSMSLRSQGFGGGNLMQFNESRINQNDQKHVNDCYDNQNAINFSQQQIRSAQISYSPSAGRSSAGRPAHALVTFGFGGKLIVLKDNNPAECFNLGSQNLVGGSISVLDLAEVVNSDAIGVCNYFQALCHQCIPGPLSGGSVGTRELNKWIDERIASPEAADMGFRKAEMKLLLSLLKIACQYYGKLRSPYGTEAVLKESDVPESAVARLFASAKGNGSQFSQYDAVAQCFQQMPSEERMQVTATEVQSLLVSGRKKEALQCALEGQLWGPALILAAQLGDQFYIETVKHMALHQFIAGSPLRTLCLLIAGQPADVFSTNTTAINGMVGAVNTPQQPGEFAANGMLDDWEENLAVITANRTKDDELVLMHLGDCLWKDRSDIIAAHICYLVAEASFEPYSDTARMCLVGSDHWKFPRTYASPEAIQRTEIYEYSKTLGNSQFVLLPFQPYKLIYTQMLAEVGRISDASKYCQTVLKSLKTGRAPEVEALRHLASSLEERIKAHQQGGFSTNLAPKKLVGKLLNLFDSTAHRVVGSIPPPVPSEKRVSSSQSTMAMSSLVPSQTADSNRKAMHTRSVSEPDFGRSPMQAHADSSKEASSTGLQEKASGRSRFRRFSFGSQLFQMTVGLVLKPRQGRQAKLGETNKFYYDEKLKRWVEEGSGPPAEEAALPPPPTTSAFQNGTSDYNLNSALQTEASRSSGIPEFKNPSVDNNSGIPPLPPTSNQYSTRGRMGVRSRYVDTFNKGGVNTTNLFQSPSSSPSIKPAASGGNPKKFFVPNPVEASAKNIQDTSTYENPSTSPLSDSSSMAMQRFGSMDNISSDKGSFPAHSRRTASWGGTYSDSSLLSSTTNGANFGDHLHEVAL